MNFIRVGVGAHPTIRQGSRLSRRCLRVIAEPSVIDGFGLCALFRLAVGSLVLAVRFLVLVLVLISGHDHLVVSRRRHTAHQLPAIGLVLIIDDAVIVFRMLKKVFRCYAVTLRVRIARQGQIFFQNLMSITTYADVRAAAVKSLISWRHMFFATNIVVAAAARPLLRILSWFHDTYVYHVVFFSAHVGVGVAKIRRRQNRLVFLGVTATKGGTESSDSTLPQDDVACGNTLVQKAFLSNKFFQHEDKSLFRLR